MKKYRLRYNKQEFITFLSYNTLYLGLDLIDILFNLTGGKPWVYKKYLKRIKRLCILCWMNLKEQNKESELIQVLDVFLDRSNHVDMLRCSVQILHFDTLSFSFFNSIVFSMNNIKSQDAQYVDQLFITLEQLKRVAEANHVTTYEQVHLTRDNPN